MLRCAILDDYQNVALQMADWSPVESRAEVVVFNAPFADEAEARDALAGFDIVCAMRERTPFRQTLFETLPQLKLLVTTGMRNASIDLEAARAHGVTVCGTNYAGNPTADLAFGLMLELTRKIGFENARMKAGEAWQVTMGRGLEGLTLGVVGLGNLGGRVARIGLAFGMRVIAWSENLTPERCAAAGVGYATREELFADADIVTVHLILSKRTRGLIGQAELNRMKPTALIVNTSRGPIIDELALVETLTQRRIGGAGLDVFWQEPLPIDHPLRKLDNVVLTPHLGYVTEENYRLFFAQTVANIEAWLDGTPLRQLT